MTVSRKSIQISGVLPPPEILERYEKVQPGFSERVLRAFERQTDHRQSLENKAQDAQIADTRRGQFFGLWIGMTAVISGSVTAIYGAELAGGFIGGGGVIGLVSVFIFGRYSRNRKPEIASATEAIAASDRH